MKVICTLFILIVSVNIVSQNNKFDDKDLIPHKKKKKWGYRNSKKKLIIPYQFEEADTFSKGRAVVKKEGKYGAIDYKGSFVIENKYEKVLPYNGFYTIVEKDSSYAIIKNDKTIFMEKWFQKISQNEDNIAKIILQNNGTEAELKESFIVGYIDSSYHLISKQWFSGGGSFEYGRAKVSKNGKYYFLYKNGVLSERKCDECDEAKPFQILKTENGKMPEFPGGEYGLRSFVAANVGYPREAYSSKIKGKVYVRFAINEKGKVVRISIAKSVHYLLDREALRVVSLMPDWKPGLIDGKLVCVWYTIPINFTF